MGISYQQVPYVFRNFNSCCKPHVHDEVEFVKGYYYDIANTPGKDRNSLYFGTSKNSNLLSGIFLGDNELTSRIKDISINKNNGVITLSVKYVNEESKLATINANLASQDEADEIKNLIGIIDNSIGLITNQINIIDTSVNLINDHINVIDSSISNIYERLNVIDASIIDLIEDLNNGKYNYTIHKEPLTKNNGFKQVYSLYKGNQKTTDSEEITESDLVLKKLKYNKNTNTINAFIWNNTIEDVDFSKNIITLTDGTKVTDVEDILGSGIVKKVSLNLSKYDEHLNVDSSVNDRLIFVENQLSWEQI